MVPIVNLLAAALFLPLLVDALARGAREPLERRDLAIWVGLGVFALGAALLSADLARESTLRYHGAAFLALTLGYSRALPTVAVIALATSPPSLAGVALIVDAALPVWLTCSLVAACRRHLPPNPFVFLLGCGFFGLFAVGAVQLVLGSVVAELLGDGGGAMMLPLAERLTWGLLLAAGEATLEGMLITVLVVYAPRAVRLFDERFYLAAPP